MHIVQGKEGTLNDARISERMPPIQVGSLAENNAVQEFGYPHLSVLLGWWKKCGEVGNENRGKR